MHTLQVAFYWLPRLMSIGFIAFISLFALDSFSQPQWFFALFMHLIPSFCLIAITAVAWKHAKLGGFLFVLAGCALLILTRFEALILGIPACGIGILFMLQGDTYASKRRFH